MLSRRARSAVAVVLDLAEHARGRPVAARALAEKHDLPPRIFETVLQDLVRAGILKGLRGPRGGYELARERRRVTLGDIARAIDLADRDATGTADRHLAPLLDPVVEEATAAYLARLDAVTVADLCRKTMPANTTSPDFTI